MWGELKVNTWCHGGDTFLPKEEGGIGYMYIEDINKALFS